MTTWHKGPPPSIGWWPASLVRDSDALRWWNGSTWSEQVYEGDSPKKAAMLAKRQGWRQDEIEWTDRPDDWPERSRT
jgi:hypothetical protein